MKPSNIDDILLDPLEEELIDELLQNNIDIYVEGITDKDLIEKWIEKQNFSHLDIQVFESIEINISDDDKVSLGYEGKLGKCDRVIIGAQLAINTISGQRKLFIADRDTRDVQIYSSIDNLFWTDFPAIESYCFTEEILNLLNKNNYVDRLHEAEYYYSSMHYLLTYLFYLRKNLPFFGSEKAKAFIHSRISSKGLDDWMEGEGLEKFEDFRSYYANLELDDKRRTVYGHDIAHVINTVQDSLHLENARKTKIYSVGDIEDFLLNIFVENRYYEGMELFNNLEAAITSYS